MNELRHPPEAYLNAKKDLLLLAPAVITPSPSLGNPNIYMLTLDNPLKGESDRMYHMTMRSRLAQVGLHVASWAYHNGTIQAHMMNLGPRSIELDEGMGIGALYQPSVPATADGIERFVSEEMEIADEDWHIKETRHGMYSLLGIRTNRQEFFEVNPTPRAPVRMNPDMINRHAVDEHVRAIERNQSNSHFVVGSTVPVAIKNGFLTLLTDRYGDLIHLQSVVIQPGSSWCADANTFSGIRCEYVHQHGQQIRRDELPEFVYFTVHPQKRGNI